MSENTPKKRKGGNRLLGTGLAALLILAAFFSGLQLGRGSLNADGQSAGLLSFLSPATKPSNEADLAEFWRVWNTLEDKFVSTSSTSTPSTEDKIAGAIAGLVESYGDPYTIYMPPKQAAEFQEEISGNFEGVGMEVGMRDEVITVIAPLPDSPAEKAGILTGDVIAKIDGKSTDSMNVDEAVGLIRGKKGTTVALTMYRKGETEFREVSIVRDVINIPTLETKVENGVYTIKLHSFNALAESKMNEAMAEYQSGNYQKLVLDLRGNPGGFLESAVSIAGWFLPTGKVVVRENFGEASEEKVYRSQGKTNAKFDPNHFVVLIDGGSASASEILAGALSEHKVATTLGDKTFGKGSVQELVEMPDDSSLKVTIARWLTPNGVSFSGGGLEPEVSIKLTPENIKEGKDPQKEAALKWLAGERKFE